MTSQERAGFTFSSVRLTHRRENQASSHSTHLDDVAQGHLYKSFPAPSPSELSQHLKYQQDNGDTGLVSHVTGILQLDPEPSVLFSTVTFPGLVAQNWRKVFSRK